MPLDREVGCHHGRRPPRTPRSPPFRSSRVARERRPRRARCAATCEAVASETGPVKCTREETRRSSANAWRRLAPGPSPTTTSRNSGSRLAIAAIARPTPVSRVESVHRQHHGARDSRTAQRLGSRPGRRRRVRPAVRLAASRDAAAQQVPLDLRSADDPRCRREHGSRGPRVWPAQEDVGGRTGREDEPAHPSARHRQGQRRLPGVDVDDVELAGGQRVGVHGDAATPRSAEGLPRPGSVRMVTPSRCWTEARTGPWVRTSTCAPRCASPRAN